MRFQVCLLMLGIGLLGAVKPSYAGRTVSVPPIRTAVTHAVPAVASNPAPFAGPYSPYVDTRWVVSLTNHDPNNPTTVKVRLKGDSYVAFRTTNGAAIFEYLRKLSKYNYPTLSNVSYTDGHIVASVVIPAGSFATIAFGYSCRPTGMSFWAANPLTNEQSAVAGYMLGSDSTTVDNPADGSSGIIDASFEAYFSFVIDSDRGAVSATINSGIYGQHPHAQLFAPGGSIAVNGGRPF